MTPQWISVEEAARRLGVSVSTIRRRIDAGELEAERVQIGGSKTAFKVRLTTPQIEQPQDMTGEASAASDYALRASEGLLALVREMRQQSAGDAERIAGLMRQLGAAEASVKLLAEQRADFARWLDETRAEVERLRARRPWWRIW